MPVLNEPGNLVILNDNEGSNMKNPLNQILSIGIKSDFDLKKIKSYRSTNFLALFFFCIASFAGFSMFFTMSRQIGIFQFLFSILYLSALLMFVLSFLNIVKGASGELLYMSFGLFPMIPLLALLFEINITVHFITSAVLGLINLLAFLYFQDLVEQIALPHAMNIMYYIA